MNLSSFFFHPAFGRMSLCRDWLNFDSVTECYDSKHHHWLPQ